MSILFSSAAIVHNPSFAAGISLDRKARRPRPDRTDLAWKAGWDACAEEGPDVDAPAHFSAAEARAFRVGRDDRFCSGQDDVIDRLEDIELDKAACGL